MNNLTTHARTELDRAGFFSDDSAYDGMLGNAVMELVEKFAAQGHSGMSAGITLDVFSRVAAFKPLSAITSDPSEWNQISNEPCWQNRRRSSTFSRDGGRTWYDIDDPKLNNGDRWVRDPIRRRLRRIIRPVVTCLDAMRDAK